jgi:4-amino-4-deoxy-L-arabinose transferase-like glycosyltransferase
VVLLAVAVAVAYSFTRSPWWDEGLYADVARQFALKGELHSSVMPPDATFGLGAATLPRMNERLYWTTPLYPVTLGLWFRAFGFGLLQMRLLSVLLSVGMVAAWGGTVAALTRSRTTALVAVGLIAVDSHVLWSASIGRVEALSSGLAACAIFAYVRWRETRLLAGVAVASALLGGAVLAHPMAVVEAAALLALALLLDWRRLRVQHVVVSVSVGALVLLPWVLYVLQDLPTFRAQWGANAHTRTGGLSHPLTQLWTELRDRYLYHHWTVAHGITRFRVLGLVALGASFAYATVVTDVRRQRGIGALALMAVVSWAALGVLDGSRYIQYYTHVFPIYLALASVPLVALLRQGRAGRLVAAGLLFGLGAPGVGGLLHRSLQDPYRSEYLPMLAAVRAHQTPGAVVVGGSELGFALGFDGAFVDDMELRRHADIYVQGELYLTDQAGGWQPRVRAELARDFDTVFQSARFKVFVRRRVDGAGTLAGTSRARTAPKPPAARGLGAS